MMPFSKLLRVASLVLLFLVGSSVESIGQSSDARPKAEIRTRVRVELLTDRRGAPLAAQRWAKLFQRFQVPLRIRRGLGGERTAVRETISGRTRQVTVVGKLDRSGRILVPGKSFSPGNPTTLGKWLKELGTFGAKGNPSGQPAFGLTEGQFNSLFETLAQPVRTDLSGKPLTEAIAAVGIPPSLPLDLASLGADTTIPPRTNGKGLSRGSTLAALLAIRGLAFRPRRTPAGRVELQIVKPTIGKAVGTTTWPLGWPPRLSRLKTARPLFQIVPVNLDKAAFLDVVDTITEKTEIPMLIDHHGLAVRKIDPTRLSVTVPAKKTSWFQLQKSITNPHHLTRDLRIDEAGKPFVLVTPIQVKPINKK